MKRTLLFALLFTAINALTAQTTTWTGAAADNLWTTSGNWDNGVPDATKTAAFTASPAAAISLTSSTSASATTVGAIAISGSATVTLSLPATTSAITSTLILNSGTSTVGSNSVLALQGVGGTTAHTLSLNFNGGSLSVDGTVRVTSAFINSTSTANISFNANSTYHLNRNSNGDFPLGTYASSSLCQWKPSTGTGSGVPVFKMNSATGSYGNVEFDVDLGTSGRAFVSASASEVTMNNLTFTRTANLAVGIGELRISNSTPTSGYVLWTVNGNLTVTANAKLGIASGALGSARLVVKGTITNDGAINTNAPTDPAIAELQMEGASTPNITGIGTFGNSITVVMNYPSNFTLSQPLAFGKVRLEAGKIILGSNNLTISATGTGVVTGTNSSKYFVTNGTGKFIMPFAAGGSTQTFNIGASDATDDLSNASITTTAGGVAGSIGVRVSAVNAIASSKGKVNRTWDITNEGGTHTVSTLALSFRDNQCQSGFDFTAPADIYHNASGLAAGLSITGSSPTRTLTASGLTLASFSPFTIVSSATLPVELVNFKGKTQGTSNLLSWQTASETNNRHFDIERSSNGFTFEKIGQVKGNGSTQSLSDYTFTDSKPNALNYYRLRQVDFDSKEQVSKVVNLGNSTKGDVKIYPSVSSTFLTVELPSETETATAVITDMLGRNLVRQNISAGQQVNISSLVSGTYFISIEVKGSKTTQRFIKN